MQEPSNLFVSSCAFPKSILHIITRMIFEECKLLRNWWGGGHLGGPVGWASDFGSGHPLMDRGFELHIRLCAESSEPGACFRFCLPLSLPLPCSHSLSFSKIKIKKTFLIKSKKVNFKIKGKFIINNINICLYINAIIKYSLNNFYYGWRNSQRHKCPGPMKVILWLCPDF